MIENTRVVVVLLVLCAMPRVLAQDSVVPQGINDRFKDPALNVDEWLGRFEVESREVYAARKQILEVCSLKSGERVADVGAGTGFYSQLFAGAVGEAGWVYSVDIAAPFLKHIAARASENQIDNLTTVLCSDTSIRLPPESVDLVFICDTYHHFEFPAKTLASIHRALKPGGRLVLIDFERIPGVSREWTLGHVRAGKEVFRQEVIDAGLDFVGESNLEGLKENYLLQFTKPRK